MPKTVSTTKNIGGTIKPASLPIKVIRKKRRRKKNTLRPRVRRKVRAIKAINRARKIGRRRRRGLLGFRWSRASSSLIIDYLEYGGRLPKVDSFSKLRPGALVKVLQGIDARTTRPKTRNGVRNFDYLMKILVPLPKGTHLMFLKRHSKLPEWYKFHILGERNVWVNISDDIDLLSIMRKPVSKKKVPC